MVDLPARIVHIRQYAAIGQFVSSFEWCCWRLRHYSCAILQAIGLRDFTLAEVIFNQRVFTAEPLFSCFASLASHATGRDKVLLERLDTLRKQFSALTKRRNDLLHGTYMIGTTQDGMPTDLLVEKQAPDKYGARTVAVVSSEAEMTQLLEDCHSLNAEIEAVFTIIWMHVRPYGGAEGA